MRDELLNGEMFSSLREAQIIIETWRNHYNTKRPHSALGYRPPAPEAIVPMNHSSGAAHQAGRLLFQCTGLSQKKVFLGQCCNSETRLKGPDALYRDAHTFRRIISICLLNKGQVKILRRLILCVQAMP